MAKRSHDNLVGGWIAPLVEVFLCTLTLPSILILGRAKLPSDIDRASFIRLSRRRALRTDTLIAITFVLSILSFLLITDILIPPARFQFLKTHVAPIFVIWRIADVVATALRVSLFDEGDKSNGHYVRSEPNRVVILALCNYLELVICFATVYAINPDLLVLSTDKPKWVISEQVERPIHFSCITQLTIGYGDYSPNGWVRVVSWCQGLIGLVIVVILIARYMSVVPEDKDDGEGKSASENNDKT